MPIESHPSFTEPDADAVLWRYMNFAKFASLVLKQALWLSNLEILAAMDPYEGALPNKNFRHRNWRSPADIPTEDLAIMKNTRYTNKNDEAIADKLRRVKEIRDLHIRQSFAYRKSYYASCWHASPHESAAMWSIYSQTGAGLAITSSVARMRKTFKDFKGSLYVGKVNYLDYDADAIDTENSFNVVLHKRKHFEHEREVRMVFWDTDVTHKTIRVPHPATGHIVDASAGREIEEIEKMEVRPGLGLACSLADLIDTVWVAPTAPAWLSQTVESLCHVMRLEDKVKISSMLSEPTR